MTQYLKAVDPDGNTTTLICRETHDKIILLQPVALVDAQGYEVQITQVSNDDEMQARIGSLIVPATDDDYNNTLFNVWGFDGSSIYRATANEGETQNADIQNNLDQQNPGTETEAQPDPVRADGLGDVSGGIEGGEKLSDDPANVATDTGGDVAGGFAENAQPVADDGNDGQGNGDASGEATASTGDDPAMADPEHGKADAGAADDSDGSADAPADEGQNSVVDQPAGEAAGDGERAGVSGSQEGEKAA